LYRTDPQIEVQISILLHDKYVKLCQNVNTRPVHSFEEKFLLGFFILQKQLPNQGIFLMRSELSITAYLFLALYGSTTLQSQSFLKNIENFLCNYKLVKQQPYNHDSFSKMLRASTALQS
jgi:hypothetical protein